MSRVRGDQRVARDRSRRRGHVHLSRCVREGRGDGGRIPSERRAPGLTRREGSGRLLDRDLRDENADAVVVGIVPLTAALTTLAPGDGHRENFTAAGGVVGRLAALRRDGGKPWIAVVDAGTLYDEMARALLTAGIPTFRSADRALRLFNVFCAERMRQTR